MANSQPDTPPMVFHRDFDVSIERGEEPTEEQRGAGGIAKLTLALSSEAPVERYDWWTGERYYEVLDHSSGGPDLTYARDGLPFLLDHSMRVQVGLMENVRLDKDKKIRGEPRPGNHPDAAWVFADINSGIRKKVSVGYDPGKNFRQIESEGDKIPTRIYTGWRLYEASTVAVPADYDVGVARSAFEGSNARERERGLPESTSRKAEETQMDGKEQPATPATPAAPAIGVGRDYDAERKVRNESLGKLATQFDAAEMLPTALAQDMDPVEFANAIGERNQKRATAPVPAGKVDDFLSRKEQHQYSIKRAIAAMVRDSGDRGPKDPKADAGLEYEVSNEIARRVGKQPVGVYFPLHMSYDATSAAAARAAVTGNIAATSSIGGAGVATAMADLIELLRNEVVTMNLGARMLPGLTSNLQFPRQLAANSWTWEGENPGTEKSLTAATFESFTLSPKTGYGATAMSKQWLLQASFDGEQMVREDLAKIAAIGIDSAAINGLGSSNQPTGVLNTTGVETVVQGTNGAVLTWANVVSYVTKQKQNNSHRGSLAYLSTPGVEGYLKTNLKNTVSGANYLIGDNGLLNGYKAEFSNQVPSNLTKGTSTTVCHGVVFGDWSELLIGVWGDVLDITINPFTYSKQGMIEVVATAMVDVGVRHPKSFVVTKDALV